MSTAPKAPSATSAPAPVAPALDEDLTERPEFRRAVADGVKEMLPQLRQEILAQLAAASPAPQSSDTKFAESLAMAIAALTNQGMGRKLPTPPEIVKMRAEAREALMETLIKARAEGRVATYTLRSKIYVDDQIVEPKWVDPATKGQHDTEIDWPGVPNDAMIPKNDVAKEIYALFQRSNSNLPKEAQNAPKEASTLWLNHGGLVVRGGPRATPAQTGAPTAHQPEGEGLVIKHKGQPGSYVQHNIVGTLAAPALETV